MGPLPPPRQRTQELHHSIVALTLTEQTDQLCGDVESFLADVRSDAKAA